MGSPGCRPLRLACSAAACMPLPPLSTESSGGLLTPGAVGASAASSSAGCTSGLCVKLSLPGPGAAATAGEDDGPSVVVETPPAAARLATYSLSFRPACAAASLARSAASCLTV